jgi:phosphate transport system protein
VSSELPPLHEPRHELRTEYQAWLDSIDDELVGGALLVVDALPRVTRGFLQADRSCVDEAHAVVTDVKDRCRRVEDQGFLLLAREAPVSGDLRRLVSILRLVHDVERSAALLRHVGEACERMDPRLLPGEIRQQLEELSSRTIDVFRRGVDAWRTRDGLAVHELDRADEDVDTLRTGLLLRAQQLEGATIELLLLGLLGRYFERLADHGVAFAQHATFVVTGERVDVGT